MTSHDELLTAIAEIVSKDYSITTKEMFNPSRKKIFAEARQIFHYLAYKHLKFPLAVIGAFSKFMGRNKSQHHATVLYSVRSIEDRISIDKAFAQYISTLESFTEEKIFYVREEIKSRKVHAERLAKEYVIKKNQNLIRSLEQLITEIVKNGTTEDVQELLKIQIKKNNGRVHKTTQSDNVVDKVSGHEHEVCVYSSIA